MQRLRARLRTIAQAQMDQDPAHDLAHLDRVWANAQNIARCEGGNHKVLLAAAYLHDLVNLPKDAPDRAQASAIAAHAAKPHLIELGFNSDEIKSVQHAIVAHSFSAGVTPETPEARIIRDADRLDALGAIGIARTFLVAGALNRPLYHPDDPFARARDLDDTAWSIDHWQVKLLKLASGMATATGRDMAHERVAVMRDYLGQLADEIGHSMPEVLADPGA